jgi:hypothetical protein
MLDDLEALRRGGTCSMDRFEDFRVICVPEEREPGDVFVLVLGKTGKGYPSCVGERSANGDWEGVRAMMSSL